MKLSARSTTPMSSDYRPQINSRAELDSNDITIFQELIGELRLATEIGRVDVLHGVLFLSAFQAATREVHLNKVFHIFDLKKKNPKLTIYFYP